MATRERPTGDADDRAYRGADTWPKKRWAWEFLRRNPGFQEACAKVARGLADKDDIAREFGLREFKHAKEPYAKKPPRFTAATISTRIRARESDADVYQRKLKLGELVVVLRLEDCLRNPAALDSQLRAVQRSARRRLAQLARDRGVSLPELRVTKVEDWIDYLRILDVWATGVSQDQVALKVYSHIFNGTETRDDRRSFVRARIDAARSFATTRYLDIAVADPEALRTKAAARKARLQGRTRQASREQ
jgi:hypothetical protein